MRDYHKPNEYMTDAIYLHLGQPGGILFYYSSFC